MPLQNGGWAVEAQRGTKQPAAARRGWLGAVLLLLLRVGALCDSAAAATLAAASATLRRAPFRFLLAADTIVAVYSAFEVARGATLLLEGMQLWFDFGYMALAVAATAARDAAGCSSGGRDVGLKWVFKAKKDPEGKIVERAQQSAIRVFHS